jgi:hypothetical protein
MDVSGWTVCDGEPAGREGVPGKRRKQEGWGRDVGTYGRAFRRSVCWCWQTTFPILRIALVRTRSSSRWSREVVGRATALTARKQSSLVPFLLLPSQPTNQLPTAPLEYD